MSYEDQKFRAKSSPANTYEIRFVDDTNLTFVNYDATNPNGFTYRKDARVHNAQRRLANSNRDTQLDLGSTRQPQLQGNSRGPISATVLDPFPSSTRNHVYPNALQNLSELERDWCSVFPYYFYLPQLHTAHSEILDPVEVFLSTARTNPALYRNIVTQAVVLAAVTEPENYEDAVLRNQALIIQDFRQLVEVFSNSCESLSSDQFQNVFASALSLSGHGSKNEQGYNAIVDANSAIIAMPDNQVQSQSSVTEWIRMLLPRPGPLFYRSGAYQELILKKVNTVLNFLDRVQRNLQKPFSMQVAKFLQPNTALYRVITTDLTGQMVAEPWPGFHLICFQRALSLVYRQLDRADQTDQPADERVLNMIESSAENCLQYPTSQCITLFLWFLISNPEVAARQDDKDEGLFAWAMKDLLAVHNFTFANEMTGWILHRGCVPTDTPCPNINMAYMKEQMHNFYTKDELNNEVE